MHDNKHAFDSLMLLDKAPVSMNVKQSKSNEIALLKCCNVCLFGICFEQYCFRLTEANTITSEYFNILVMNSLTSFIWAVRETYWQTIHNLRQWLFQFHWWLNSDKRLGRSKLFHSCYSLVCVCVFYPHIAMNPKKDELIKNPDIPLWIVVAFVYIQLTLWNCKAQTTNIEDIFPSAQTKIQYRK